MNNDNLPFHGRGEHAYRWMVNANANNEERPIWMRCQVCNRFFLRKNRSRHIQSRYHRARVGDATDNERVGLPAIPRFGFEDPPFMVDVGYDNQGRRRMKFCRLCGETVLTSNANRHVQKPLHVRRLNDGLDLRQDRIGLMFLRFFLYNPPPLEQQNWNPQRPIRQRPHHNPNPQQVPVNPPDPEQGQDNDNDNEDNQEN